MRRLLAAGLISLLFLFLSGCGGGSEDAGGFPAPVFDDVGDSGFVPAAGDVPATVEARVAATIAAQDDGLATAVAEGVGRIMRHGEEEPTPTLFVEDEVRVPVFRRGGQAQRVSGDGTPFPTPTPAPAPTPTPMPTPVPAPTPVPSTATLPPTAALSGPSCPAGFSRHYSSDPPFSLCYPSGWGVSGEGYAPRRFEDPGSLAWAELRVLDVPPTADERWLFDWFLVRVERDEGADAGYRLLERRMDDASGRYGGYAEYLHDASRLYSCVERVTARVYLSDYHPDAGLGYVLLFGSCDGYAGEFAPLRGKVLSGFSESFRP